MKKSIAVLGSALLIAAAWSRPAPEVPSVRRPAPAGAAPLPPEGPRPGFLEVLLRTTLATTEHPCAPELAIEVHIQPEDLLHMKVVKQEIARLLEHAYVGIYQSRYDLTVAACDKILRIDPYWDVALELRRLALRLRHTNAADQDSIFSAIQPLAEQTLDDAENPSIPRPQVLRFPSRDEWAERFVREEPSAEEALSLEAIHRKLETMKIDLDFENTKLEDILAFLRDYSGLNILLDAAVRDQVVPDQTITFKVKDLVLKNILKLLLSQFQLDYFVTEEMVVLLTDVKRPTAASSTVSDGGRDILTLLGAPFADPPLTPQEPAVFIESLFIDLDVQNVPMSYIIDLLRRGTGLDICLVEEVEGTVSFKVTGTSLRAALMLLLQPRNLTLTFENATVWIGRPRT